MKQQIDRIADPTFLELKSTSVCLMTHYGGRWWHTVYQHLAIHNCRDDVR